MDRPTPKGCQGRESARTRCQGRFRVRNSCVIAALAGTAAVAPVGGSRPGRRARRRAGRYDIDASDRQNDAGPSASEGSHRPCPASPKAPSSTRSAPSRSPSSGGHRSPSTWSSRRHRRHRRRLHDRADDPGLPAQGRDRAQRPSASSPAIGADIVDITWGAMVRRAAAAPGRAAAPRRQEHHRRRVGQGRRRQEHGQRQPRGRARPGRGARRPARRRHHRAEHPADDGSRGPAERQRRTTRSRRSSATA